MTKNRRVSPERMEAAHKLFVHMAKSQRDGMFSGDLPQTMKDLGVFEELDQSGWLYLYIKDWGVKCLKKGRSGKWSLSVRFLKKFGSIEVKQQELDLPPAPVKEWSPPLPLDDVVSVPCRICGTATTSTGTKLCNACWEINSRIDGLPFPALVYFRARFMDKTRQGYELINQEGLEDSHE